MACKNGKVKRSVLKTYPKTDSDHFVQTPVSILKLLLWKLQVIVGVNEASAREEGIASIAPKLFIKYYLCFKGY